MAFGVSTIADNCRRCTHRCWKLCCVGMDCDAEAPRPGTQGAASPPRGLQSPGREARTAHRAPTPPPRSPRRKGSETPHRRSQTHTGSAALSAHCSLTSNWGISFSETRKKLILQTLVGRLDQFDPRMRLHILVVGASCFRLVVVVNPDSVWDQGLEK